MRIIQIVGTRPNLVKFINITGNDYVVYTNQHYDLELIAKEVKVGKVLKKGESFDEVGDLVVVYGDTFSAEWGANWAKDHKIPLVHIEAGVRLGDLMRVEEKIRIQIDKMSDYLFCVNEFHAENLRKEGVKGKIFVVGDLHYDQYLKNRFHRDYGVLTIHRREHIEVAKTLQGIFDDLAKEGWLKFYCHPHTRKKIKEFKIKVPKSIEIFDPISYEDMMETIRVARVVITDSGGLTREACFSGVPVKNIGKTEWKREIRMFGNCHAGDKIREILLDECRSLLKR